MKRWRSAAFVIVLLLWTIVLPMRAMGWKPSWRRPWPLECGKFIERGAAHQEILQDAVVDEGNVLSRNALIIERIVAEQDLAINIFCGGIVANGNEIGKNRLPDLCW